MRILKSLNVHHHLLMKTNKSLYINKQHAIHCSICFGMCIPHRSIADYDARPCAPQPAMRPPRGPSHRIEKRWRHGHEESFRQINATHSAPAYTVYFSDNLLRQYHFQHCHSRRCWWRPGCHRLWELVEKEARRFLWSTHRLATQRSALLRLPPEIRNLIYRYVLIFEKPIRVGLKFRVGDSNLLGTCLQIYEEAVDLFCYENTFVIPEALFVGNLGR